MHLVGSSRTLHFLHEPELPPVIPSRPIDATLSVTKAARLLGVHPNTIRAWSDAGRLRYYRINPRGDRRYRIGDLQRFLAAAESGKPPEIIEKMVTGRINKYLGDITLLGQPFVKDPETTVEKLLKKVT